MILIIVAAGNLYSQELSFTISLDKAIYNKGEPVKCTLTIKNVSNKDQVVNNRFLVNLPTGPHEVSLQILDSDLYTIPFASLIRASFDSHKFILLAPGKTEMKTYTVTGDFDLLKTGKYSITAYYENQSDTPASLKMSASWKGSLISNKAIFNLR
jgi:hypothetical protein